MIDSSLLAKVRTRAADPSRRTDAPPAVRGRSVSFGPLTLSAVTLGAAMAGRFDPPPVPSDAMAPRATQEDIARAGERLGFALPEELVQVLTGIADGGFGPGPGLLPLAEMVSRYAEFTRVPAGPRGQQWPANLLPVSGTDPGYVCIDCGSGKLVFWDEEMLAESESGRQWKRSFKPEADSLAAWLAAWVDTVSPEQRAQRMLQDTMLNGLRTTLNHWRAKTPEERRAFGLPDTGWEQHLFGHLGIDLTKL